MTPDNVQQLRFQAQLLDAIGQAVIATNLEGTITYWNRAATGLYGWTAEEVLGRNIADVTPTQTSSEQAADIMAQLREGKRWSGEFLVQRKDGSTFLAHVTDTPFYDDAGKLAGIIGVSTDISEQTRVQQALARSEQEVRAVFESVHEAFILIDRNYCIRTFNHTSQKWSHAISGKVMHPGDPIRPFIRETDWDEFKQHFHQALTGTSCTVEKKVHDLHGAARWLVFTYTPVRDDHEEIIGVCLETRDVTEQKQAEQALKSSETRFHAIFEHAGAGIAIALPNENIIDVNQRLCDMLGYTKQELLQRTVRELTFPEDFEKEVELTEAVLAGEKDYFNAEKRYIHKQGHLVWGNLSSKVIRDENGDIQYVTGVVVDITERKRVEAALRESQERYRHLVETSPDSIVLTDIEGHILMCNQKTADFHGYAHPEDLVGKNGFDFIAPEDVEKAKTNLSKALQGMPVKHIEYQMIRKDGTRFWAELNTRLIYDEAGEPQAFIGVTRDITERKATEAALEEGRTLFRNVVEQSTDGIMVTDRDGNIALWNQAEARITGLDAGAVMGRPIAEILFQLTPKEKQNEARQSYLQHTVQETLKTGKATWLNQLIEREIQHSGGEHRITQSVMFAIKTNAGFTLASTIRDITEQKKIETALQEKQELLSGIISNSPNLITLMDRQGRYLLVNHATAQFYGCSEVDLIGKTFAEVLGPETATTFMARIQKILDTEHTLQVEDEILTAEGERFFTTTLFPVLDLKGDISAISGIAIEVTAQKQAEQALRESEARYRTLVENAQDAIFLVDEAGTFLMMNPAAAEHLGNDLQNLTGKTMWDLFPQEIAESQMQDIWQVMTSKQGLNRDMVMTTMQGQTRVYSISLQPLIDAQGSCTRVQCIAHDVTERWHVEQAVAEERARMDTILSTLDTGLSLINPDMTIAWVNRKIRDMFPDEQPEGNICYQFYEGRSTPCEGCVTQHAFMTGEIQKTERFNPKDKRWYRIISQPVKDTQGQVRQVLEGITDITERKQAEEVLRKRSEERHVLLDMLPVGVTITDETGAIIEANHISEQLLGIPVEEQTQRNFDGPGWQTIRPDGSPMPPDEYASVRALKEQRTIRNIEAGIVKGDDTVTWISVSAAPLPLEGYGVVIAYADITARQQMEQALRRSETRYRFLVNALSDSLYVLDHEWRHVLVNEAAIHYVHMPKEKLLGNTLMDLFPGITETAFFPVFQRVMERRESDSVIHEYVHENGSQRWYEVRIFPVPEGILCLSRDITERKQAETALRTRLRYEENLARLSKALLADISSDNSITQALGHLREAADTARVYIFQNCVDDLGRLCMRHTYESCAPDVPSQLNNPELKKLPYAEGFERWASDLSQGTPIRGRVTDFPSQEQIILAPQGIRSMLVLPLNTSQGWEGFIGFDETRFDRVWHDEDVRLLQTAAEMIGSYMERRYVQNALRISEARYRSLFTNNHAAMLLIDPDTGEIVDANPAACTYYGYTWGQLTSREINDLNTLSEAQVYEEMQRARTEARRQFFFRHRLAGGEVRDVEVYSGPIEVQDRQLLYSIVHDITARKRAEAKLQEYTTHLEEMVQEKVRQLEQERAKAIQMDKMAAIGQMATGVAHELNQPLTVIALEIDYLNTAVHKIKSQYHGDITALFTLETLEEVSESLKGGLVRFRRITDHMRSFGRATEEDVKYVNLNTPIENSLIFAKARLKDHQVRLELNLVDDLPLILANAHQLEQVFLNLIANAEYAMEQQATTAEAREDITYRKKLCISTFVEGKHVIATVADNGCGIPEDDQAHIFEPFYTTKPEGKGTGLGLSISYDIIQACKGEITFDSVEGEGTTFTLRFPIAEAKLSKH